MIEKGQAWGVSAPLPADGVVGQRPEREAQQQREPTRQRAETGGEPEGEGSAPEDELASERQLFGNELPDKMLSLTFDDPSFAAPLHVAAFQTERPGEYEVTWRRRQDRPAPAEAGGRPRRRYRVTPAGRKAAAQSMSDLVRMRAGIEAMLAPPKPS